MRVRHDLRPVAELLGGHPVEMMRRLMGARFECSSCPVHHFGDWSWSIHLGDRDRWRQLLVTADSGGKRVFAPASARRSGHFFVRIRRLSLCASAHLRRPDARTQKERPPGQGAGDREEGDGPPKVAVRSRYRHCCRRRPHLEAQGGSSECLCPRASVSVSRLGPSPCHDSG